MAAEKNPILLDVPRELSTPRLLLRAVMPGDGAIVFPSVRQSLAELKPWMIWAKDDYDQNGAEEWCRTSAAGFLQRKSMQYLILSRQDGRHLGTIGAFNFHWEIPSAEIGYWLHTAHIGKGLMTEAVRVLADMLFQSLAMQRVEIRADSRNQRSRRVAELAGFELEGILRHDALDVHGQPRDTCVFSRIASVKKS